MTEGSRPPQLVLVAGTGTEVGKTWLACRLAMVLRQAGTRVAARKPAQSFAPEDAASATTDAHLLAAATNERPEDVCPRHRWYEVPMAPFMAADSLARSPFTLADLVGEIAWPEGPGASGGRQCGVHVGLVEPAGGVRSPMTHDGGDTVDLARALRPDLVVLVADAGLGTINAVRSALEPLADHGHGYETVVFLNRYDDGDELHRRNRAWLTANAASRVVTTVADVAACLGGESQRRHRPG